MRNRWGIEIKKGYHAWYRGGRNGTEEGEGRIVSVDRSSDSAKAYGPLVQIASSDGEESASVSADAIYQVLPPMKIKPGGIVTANPTPRLDRYDQPSQREHVTPKGKRSKTPTERLKQRRIKTHYAKTPGVWANPLVRVKVKSPAQRGKGEPSPRLVARRKTTQKAPAGFYANPLVKGESNADAARYAELYGGAPDTVRAWSDHYIVRFHKPGEKTWSLISVFKSKTLAMQYARAYAREHPTYTVSVIDKA